MCESHGTKTALMQYRGQAEFVVGSKYSFLVQCSQFALVLPVRFRNLDDNANTVAMVWPAVNFHVKHRPDQVKMSTLKPRSRCVRHRNAGAASAICCNAPAGTVCAMIRKHKAVVKKVDVVRLSVIFEKILPCCKRFGRYRHGIFAWSRIEESSVSEAFSRMACDTQHRP